MPPRPPPPPPPAPRPLVRPKQSSVPGQVSETSTRPSPQAQAQPSTRLEKARPTGPLFPRKPHILDPRPHLAYVFGLFRPLPRGTPWRQKARHVLRATVDPRTMLFVIVPGAVLLAHWDPLGSKEEIKDVVEQYVPTSEREEEILTRTRPADQVAEQVIIGSGPVDKAVQEGAKSLPAEQGSDGTPAKSSWWNSSPWGRGDTSPQAQSAIIATTQQAQPQPQPQTPAQTQTSAPAPSQSSSALDGLH